MSEENRQETHELSLVRTRSLTIASFPWLSAAVGSRPDIRTFASSDHCLSAFLHQLRDFERGCLLAPGSREGKYFRHLLGLEYTQDETPVLRAKEGPKKSPQDWSALASIVCAYRLADVVALLETQPTVLPAPVLRTQKLGPSTPLPWLYRLDNWNKLLTKFKSSYSKEKKPIYVDSIPGNSHIGLLKNIVHCSVAGNLNNISANLFTAALHLQYLMKHSYRKDQLPELAESFQELTSVRLSTSDATNSQQATSLSEEEVTFWTETFGTSRSSATQSSATSGKERQPLHLALAISPLYLLIPDQIMSRTIGRENIISTSMALGNQRPPRLENVEKSIWRVLFRLAKGVLQPAAALQAVYEAVPWSTLEDCPEGETSWFKLPKVENTRQKQTTTKNADSLSVKSTHVALVTPRLNESTRSMTTPTKTTPTVCLETVANGASIDSNLTLSGTAAAVEFPPFASLDAYCNKNLDTTLNGSKLPSFDRSHSNTAASDSGPHRSPVSPPESISHLDQSAERRRSTSPMDIQPDQASGGDLRIDEDDIENRTAATQESEDEVVRSLRSAIKLGDLDMVVDKDDDEGSSEEEQAARHLQMVVDKEDDESSSEKEQTPPLSIPKIRLRPATSKTTVPSVPLRTLRPSVPAIPLVVIPKTGPTGPSAPPRTLRSSSSRSTVALPASAAFGKSVAPRKRKRAPTTVEDRPSRKTKLEADEDSYIIPKLIHLDLQAGNSPDHPVYIDVDQYSLFNILGDKLEHVESDLQPVSGPGNSQRVTTKAPLCVWDAALKKHEFLPRFHHKAELVKFVHFMASVSNNHIQGVPKHVKSPSDSAFHIMDYGEYSSMTELEILAILQRKCIVVREMNWPDMAFDERGLSTLSPLDAVISIQDLSLPLDKNGSDRIQNGTLSQMLESSQDPVRVKALNALSFPFANGDSERSCFDRAPQASCRTAWRNTSGTVFPREAAMPLSDVHWGLAATGGANTLWHIDSDGLGTTVDVRVGEKLWIVGSDAEEKFTRLGLLLSDSFDLDSPPQSFSTEAILLTAKTRLIMPPNVVHAVFTPKDTICHGSHFYATSTMQATLASLMHGFVCHHFITNISHPKTRVFHRRLFHFYHRGLALGSKLTDIERAHLPRIDVPVGASVNIDEVLNFLSVCALVLFANALDPRSYMAPGQGKDEDLTEPQTAIMELYDVNAISEEERDEMCTARGACLAALAWFRSSYRVKTADSDDNIDLPSTFFIQVVRSLLRYKFVAEKNSITAAGDCQLVQLEVQVESALELDADSWRLWESNGSRSWLDDELCDAECVEVDEEVGATLGSSQEEGEIGDVCMDNEEGELEEIIDRRIEIKAAWVRKASAMTTGTWRQEKLGLEDKGKYAVVRISNAQSPLPNYAEWKKEGETSRDRKYAEGVFVRKASEALGMKGHIMKATS